MRYSRWLVLTALAVQLSAIQPLWAQNELSFTRQDFGVGDGPISVTVGDFNSDSQQDLATAKAFDAAVSILLGNGEGTFSPASWATSMAKTARIWPPPIWPSQLV